MPRKRLDKNKIRKITKTGNDSSYYVTLPIDLIREFGWREGQKVVVRKYKGKARIVIQDWKDKNFSS